MKKQMIALVAGLLLSASTSYGYWIGSVNTGDGWINGVETFDWSTAGSGVAVGIKPGDVLSPGPTFNFKYQANLVNLQGPGGVNLSTPNLNTNYEYTVVADITEAITGFTTFGTTQIATFSPIAGTAYIYYDSNASWGTNSTKANTATGSGFDDGIEVLKANIIGGGSSVFTYNTATGTGGGGTSPTIDFTINPISVSSSYLNPSSLVNGMSFHGSLAVPALDSSTTAFFLSLLGGGNFSDYSVTSSDLVFKVDGDSKIVTPEPSTFMLLGAGLLGAGIISRRKNNK